MPFWGDGFSVFSSMSLSTPPSNGANPELHAIGRLAYGGLPPTAYRSALNHLVDSIPEASDLFVFQIMDLIKRKAFSNSSKMSREQVI